MSLNEAELINQSLKESGLTRRQLNVILVAVISGMFLATLDTSIMNVALPAISGEFGLADEVVWIVISYLVTLTIVTPVYGKLSDIFGRKATFQVAASIFVVFSALAGFSTELWHLVATRAFQGIGAGGLIALPMVIMGDLIPPSVRGRYMGYLSTSVVLSSLAGPLLGGLITDYINWRFIFFINIPIGVVSMVMVHRKLTVKLPRLAHSIDMVGIMLLVLALGPALIALQLGGDQLAWDHPLLLVLLAMGVVMLVLFVLWEGVASEPLLPLRIFRNSIIAVSMSSVFVLGMALFASSLFVPIYLQYVKGVSATESGLLVFSLSIGMSCAAFVSGRLITRQQSYRYTVIFGMFSLAVGLGLLGTLEESFHPLVVTAYMSVIGIGLGSSLPALSLVVQNAVAYKDLGISSTTLNFIRSVGSAIGAAGFGAFYSDRLLANMRQNVSQSDFAEYAGDLLGQPGNLRAIADEAVRQGGIMSYLDSVKVVFWAGAAVAVVAFLISLWLKDIPLRSTLREESDSDVAAPESVASTPAAPSSATSPAS